MTDLPQTNQTAAAVRPGALPQTRIIARPTVADWTIRLTWRDTFGALHELTGDLKSYRRSDWGKLAPDGPLPAGPTLKALPRAI